MGEESEREREGCARAREISYGHHGGGSKDGGVALPHPVQSPRPSVLPEALLRPRGQRPPLLQGRPRIEKRGISDSCLMILLFCIFVLSFDMQTYIDVWSIWFCFFFFFGGKDDLLVGSFG